jgi:hypothetical protein
VKGIWQVPSTPAEIIIPLSLVGAVAIWLVIQSSKRDARTRLQADRFHYRQQHPDFEAYREVYGRQMPASLRLLLENSQWLANGGDSFEVILPAIGDNYRWYVDWLEPIDQEALGRQRWPGTEGYYVMANDGFGNEYLLDPAGADPEVIFYDHETGERTPTGVPLSCFLGGRRPDEVE